MFPTAAAAVSKINPGQAGIGAGTFTAAVLSLQAHDWLAAGVGFAGLLFGVIWHTGLHNLWGHLVYGDRGAVEANQA